MRIAHYANVFRPIPPVGYGGTQNAIAQLSIAQAFSGHDVTVYAPKDSTLAWYVSDIARKRGYDAVVEQEFSASNQKNNELIGESVTLRNGDLTGRLTLRSGGVSCVRPPDPAVATAQKQLIDQLLEDEKEHPFDIIHTHYHGTVIDQLDEAGLLHKKVVATVHNCDLPKNYERHSYPLVAISEAHARQLEKHYHGRIAGVAYHGLPQDLYHFQEKSAGYLAWIGRLSDEKGAARAIAIARKAGMPLILAGDMSKPEQRAYFEKHVAPHLTHSDPRFLDRIARLSPKEISSRLKKMKQQDGAPPIIYAGEANEAQKQTLLGNAAVTLFPVMWEEPFGLVQIESMACGTPVLAFAKVGDTHCGSVEEVVRDEVSGHKIHAPDEANAIDQSASLVCRTAALPRRRVRDEFEARWSIEQNAKHVANIYRELSLHAPGTSVTLNEGRERG